MNLTLGDKNYAIGKMPPLTQFHVMRRFSIVTEALAARAIDPDESDGRMGMALMSAFGNLSEDDANYILGTTLSRVTRQDSASGTWAPLWAGGTLMFQDLEMSHMIQLVMHVIQENLGPFSDARPPA